MIKKGTLSLLIFILGFINLQGQTEFVTKWRIPKNVTFLSFNAVTSSYGKFHWETIPPGQSGSGFFNNGSNGITALPSGTDIILKLESKNLKSFFIDNKEHKEYLIEVLLWGNANWESMQRMFAHCTNLREITALDAPDLSTVNSLKEMFLGCKNLSHINGISSWKTHNVRDMSSMFEDCKQFNQSLEGWFTGNVASMSKMFNGATSFNQPLQKWNTSAVTDMSWMFGGASSFNQPLENWNTSAVTDMSSMFGGASSFNQPIENWNTSAVTNMSYMFSGAPSFNQPLEKLNTSAVTNMSYMFSGASSFNQPLEKLNTSSVTNMSWMFNRASSFNQPLENWNTSAVTNMVWMFYSASSFNQSLEKWNTSAVKFMQNMFEEAISFNQPLENWNTSAVTDMSWMFYNATSFNQPLEKWNTSAVTGTFKMFEGAISFNQPLGNWDISNLKSIIEMFKGASAFNQDLSQWDFSNVLSLKGMFENAISYNQPLDNWNLSRVQNMDRFLYGAINFNQSLENINISSLISASGMLVDCGMSCSNYSKTLQSWATKPNTPNSIIFYAAGSIYSPDISNFRDSLIKKKKWIIFGDKPNKNVCSDSSSSLIYPTFRDKFQLYLEERNYLVDSFWILGYNLKQDIKIKSNSLSFKISEKIDSNYDTILNFKIKDSIFQKQLIYIKFEANQFRYHYAEITIESGNLKDTFKIEGERKSESMLTNMVEKATYKIYPNPSFGQLNIETNTPQDLKILNSVGEVIYHLTGENNYKVDIQHLPTGYYYIVTESGFTYKLLKL